MTAAPPPPPSPPPPSTATGPAATPDTERLASSPAPRRIVALDVLRGFALTGIIFVNIEWVVGLDQGPPTLDDPSGWLQLFVQQRFFPLFSLMFGVSSALVLASAQRRGARPRLVLLRRLLVLLPLGVAHQLLQPGEALAPYAIVGLIVLLPSTWLPRWAVAVGGVALLAYGVSIGGGLGLIPGLFLIGSVLVRYGVVARIEDSVRVPLALFVVFALASVPALVAQLGDLENSGFSTPSAAAGAAMAGAYATGVLLLLRAAPLRPVLVAAFAPLGRMALTNYVGATLVMVLARHPLDLQDSTAWTPVLLLAAGIILVQAAGSTWWLARFRYGPLEWLWRWATWGRRPAFARPPRYGVPVSASSIQR